MGLSVQVCPVGLLVSDKSTRTCEMEGQCNPGRSRCPYARVCSEMFPPFNSFKLFLELNNSESI